jgi:hypothetical protein
MASNETFSKTVFYKNHENVIICSLKLTHKTGNDSSVCVDSPNNLIKSSFIKISSLNTQHHFVVHSVKNGNFVDYINSIALCLISAHIPCNVLIGASYMGSTMVYSPESDTVEYFYCKNFNDKNIFEDLKGKCLENYEKVLSLI